MVYILFYHPTPKPTPHRKLSAFFYFQNTSFCMIYKLGGVVALIVNNEEKGKFIIKS